MISEYEKMNPHAVLEEIVAHGTKMSQGDGQQWAKELLMQVTHTSTIEDAHVRLVGRPHLGSSGGPAKVIQAKIPHEYEMALEKLGDMRHVSRSHLIREALKEYLLTQPELHEAV